MDMVQCSEYLFHWFGQLPTHGQACGLSFGNPMLVQMQDMIDIEQEKLFHVLLTHSHEHIATRELMGSCIRVPCFNQCPKKGPDEKIHVLHSIRALCIE